MKSISVTSSNHAIFNLTSLNFTGKFLDTIRHTISIVFRYSLQQYRTLFIDYYVCNELL